jgi:hypothetical protein
MIEINTEKDSANIRDKKRGEPITVDELTKILEEVQSQPIWRGRADKEADYLDGNQLSSDILQRQKLLGIPPAMENIIKPQMQALAGYEAKTRKDWRITPDGDPDGVDVADALNYRLNQAERHSGADRACAEAFYTQAAVGIGWVEVSRNTNPMEYPYRCTYVRRGEIWWDMLGEDRRELKDCRWLLRSRWIDPKRLQVVFPEKSELLTQVSGRWSNFFELSTDGNASTGLTNSWDTERSWTIDEQQWYDSDTKRVKVYEVWYRRWVECDVLVVHEPTGPHRAVEFDATNPAHQAAAASGRGRLVRASLSRMRRAFFIGPHMLHDGTTPYAHEEFPYVPFMHHTEDATGVPYGMVRDMVFAQDALNATTARLIWGLAAVRTERTKGILAMEDSVFRQQVARIDADIVLDPIAASQPGARFDVKRDFQLNDQHFQLMQDSRASIVRSSGVSDAFQGRQGTATSGLQEQTQVEQSTQALAGLMDRFSMARAKVGDLLLRLIIEDIGTQQQVVVIDGNPLKPARTVVLNRPEVDEFGIPYLSNDVQRIRLRVSLEDVATTPSFRAQQLSALSEVAKSLPPQAQSAIVPHLVALMDVPNRNDVIQSVQKALAQETPEQVEERIKKAVEDALEKAGIELKAREVAIKESKQQAEIQEINNRAVQVGVQAAYAAMQAGQVIATMPQVAPIADKVMQGAGYQLPTPAGQDPNFPMPATGVLPAAPANVPQNTSPAFPPVPQQAGVGSMDGIETATAFDNQA